MKKMLLGIFLLLLSIWCLIFGISDNFAPIIYGSLILLIVAIVEFIIGYYEGKI